MHTSLFLVFSLATALASAHSHIDDIWAPSPSVHYFGWYVPLHIDFRGSVADKSVVGTRMITTQSHIGMIRLAGYATSCLSTHAGKV